MNRTILPFHFIYLLDKTKQNKSSQMRPTPIEQ